MVVTQTDDFEVPGDHGLLRTEAARQHIHPRRQERGVPGHRGRPGTTDPPVRFADLDRDPADDRGPGRQPQREHEAGRPIGALKQAVATFLEGMPPGSRVAVVAFSSEVELICPFTTDPGRVREAVDGHRGGWRHSLLRRRHVRALELLAEEPGRRAVLALTDGQDTISKPATLTSAIKKARQLNLPVHTLGLGNEREIAVKTLARLATETRGQHYLAAGRRPAPQDLRGDRPAARVELQPHLSDRPKSPRRDPQADPDLLPEGRPGRRDRRLHPRHGRPRRRVVEALFWSCSLCSEH